MRGKQIRESVRSQVRIRQKAIRYTPLAKLMHAPMTIRGEVAEYGQELGRKTVVVASDDLPIGRPRATAPARSTIYPGFSST